MSSLLPEGTAYELVRQLEQSERDGAAQATAATEAFEARLRRLESQAGGQARK